MLNLSTGMANPDSFPMVAAPDSDSESSVSSVTASSVSSVSELNSNRPMNANQIVQKRKRLLRKVEALKKAGKDTQKLAGMLSQLDRMPQAMHGGMGMGGVGGAPNGNSIDMALVRAIYDLYCDLQKSSAQTVVPDSMEQETFTVRDLLRESNLRIAKIIQTIEHQFGQELKQDEVPEASVLLPKLLLQQAQSMKKLNDYTEGILMHTMQRLELFQRGGQSDDSASMIANPLGKRWVC
eukprot:c7018_g1_i3.p1 GENE.c7018_g1_i3~~c7018_g1_i3.p1  ORF type:complete len:259 (+),score=75.12 c7018_g1_i3:66-779(+)